MNLIKSLWAFASAFTVFLLLWLLRLANVLGSEYDLLQELVSTISSILCGVFIGILISDKKIQVRRMIGPFLLFVAGFLVAPFVGVGVLMFVEMFPFSRGIEPIVFGGSVMGICYFIWEFGFGLRRRASSSSETSQYDMRAHFLFSALVAAE